MGRHHVKNGATPGRHDTMPGDWIRRARDAVEVERIEAFFSGRGYDMHRHDTYAIGRTLSGVQSFHYRGAVRNSLPGGTLVLHPDEKHDGQAGGDAGFQYRLVYLAPSLIQAVLGGRALPFVPGGLSDCPLVAHAAGRLLKDIDDPIEVLEFDDALFDLAHALERAAGATPGRPQPADRRAAMQARACMDADAAGDMTMAALEQATGCSRWTLSRDFRLLFGTSPYRYVVMRRLDRVKALLRSGSGLAEAALAAGFADQSHMTRHFSRAYGLPPSRWQRFHTH